MFQHIYVLSPNTVKSMERFPDKKKKGRKNTLVNVMYQGKFFKSI